MVSLALLCDFLNTMHFQHRLFIFIFCCLSSSIAQTPIIPTDGMHITTNTLFKSGTYSLKSGVIITSSDVTLDLGGAILLGDDSGTGAGVTISSGINHVAVISTFPGAQLRGYFYGIIAINVTDLLISDIDLSSNWVDLKSNQTWLDINAPPNLTDKVNLGGGLFLQNTTNVHIRRIISNNQENGIDVYHSTQVLIHNITASYNTGWGVHFFNTTYSTIVGNILDHNIRQNDGDSAGLLLVYGSNHNIIINNSFQYSGDGAFIGNENGCPSNFNLFEANDASHSSANAFEATFSNGNIFRANRASYSSYGFWLGFSYNSTIDNNDIRGNGCGIDIDHGQYNTITGNRISNTNGPGIQLTSDGSAPFSKECLNLPNQTVSGYTLVTRNTFMESNNFHLMLKNTTFSFFYDNIFGPNLRPGTISADNLTTTSSKFQISTSPQRLIWPERNVVGGEYSGGNWYVDYLGKDTTGDGIGDTDIPYTAAGSIQNGGDNLPLKIPNSP
jgi:parallel beta-helix repeat protein